MAFFRTAQKSGAVFRYEIFNINGYSMLVSDRNGLALADLSEYSTDAARSGARGDPVVDVKEGRMPDLPSFFASAYVPVLVGGRPVAVVAAYVDRRVSWPLLPPATPAGAKPMLADRPVNPHLQAGPAKDRAIGHPTDALSAQRRLTAYQTVRGKIA